MFKWAKGKYVFSYRFSFALICVILIISLLINFSLRSKNIDNNLENTDKSLLYKLSLFVSYPMMPLFNLYDNMVIQAQERRKNCDNKILKAYLDIQKENDFLKSENYTLRLLTKFNYQNTKLIATARTIITTEGFFSKIIRINAGNKQGIKIGDIAITNDGLVGRIIKTYNDSSDILPIHHSLSKIAAMSLRKKIKILISGRSQNHAVAEYISEPLLVKSGDKIVSLSDGGRLPYGIMIGTIGNMNSKPVEIKLAVNFVNLDYIQIIRFNSDENS